mmetsp:Transcript_2705/g.6492  ORF Transcript_2705/g.6492 Transcript_2705/m.6492 type:complete len:237 (-) Transcript_2705:105-815(-)
MTPTPCVFSPLARRYSLTSSANSRPSMESRAMSISADCLPRSLSRTQPPATRSVTGSSWCLTTARSVAKIASSSGVHTTVAPGSIVTIARSCTSSSSLTSNEEEGKSSSRGGAKETARTAACTAGLERRASASLGLPVHAGEQESTRVVREWKTLARTGAPAATTLRARGVVWWRGALPRPPLSASRSPLKALRATATGMNGGLREAQKPCPPLPPTWVRGGIPSLPPPFLRFLYP